MNHRDMPERPLDDDDRLRPNEPGPRRLVHEGHVVPGAELTTAEAAELRRALLPVVAFGELPGDHPSPQLVGGRVERAEP